MKQKGDMLDGSCARFNPNEGRRSVSKVSRKLQHENFTSKGLLFTATEVCNHFYRYGFRKNIILSF